MQPADLDRAMSVALYAAAGELQREIAEVGPQRISESDMRFVMRRSLQAQLGSGVSSEWPVPKTSDWYGRLGAFDVGVCDGDELVGAAELKWCRDANKIGEAIWDALKLFRTRETTSSLSARI